MARPCIAFLTDFGTDDHYVGSMKGVTLGICPDAALVDVTHGIPPQDVATGAWELAVAHRAFPQGTVFVAVVDPGVGSTRKGLAAEAGGYRFVAPDNGLLAVVLEESPPTRVVELRNPAYARATVSRTFEGRDRFAPAAAWLATGVDLDALGPRLDAWTPLDTPRVEVHAEALHGAVIRVDRFGNLMTNISRAQVVTMAGERPVTVTVGGHAAGPLRATYAELSPGVAGALVSSNDHVEIALAGGSAAASLGAGPGATVHVRWVVSDGPGEPRR